MAKAFGFKEIIEDNVLITDEINELMLYLQELRRNEVEQETKRKELEILNAEHINNFNINLQSFLFKIPEKEQEINDFIGKCEGTIKDIDVNTKKCKKLIKGLYNDILNELNESVTVLINNLKRTQLNKKDNINKQIKTFKDYLGVLNEWNIECNALIDSEIYENDSNLLKKMKKFVPKSLKTKQERLTKIINKYDKINIPINPICNDSINLDMNNKTKYSIIESIKNIGSVNCKSMPILLDVFHDDNHYCNKITIKYQIWSDNVLSHRKKNEVIIEWCRIDVHTFKEINEYNKSKTLNDDQKRNNRDSMLHILKTDSCQYIHI